MKSSIIKLPVSARYDRITATCWLADANGERVPANEQQVDYLIELLNRQVLEERKKVSKRATHCIICFRRLPAPDGDVHGETPRYAQFCERCKDELRAGVRGSGGVIP